MIKMKSLLLESTSKTVMTYLTGKGLTAKQAAGLAGNLQQESQFDPRADNGSHYGIAQWDKKNRWPAVKKQIKKDGLDPETLSGQLYGVYWEAKDRGDWDDLKLTKTIEGAMQSWLTNFERSGEKAGTAGYNKRLSYAIDLYNEYTSKTQKTKTPSEKNTSTKTHIVKSGDTLSGIAKKYNTTVDAIKKANALKSDLIKIDQKLIIK
jgi:LysM repeat protein